ncbi:hypothetical protein D9619_001327 [Psilocybe cf. subviscida]|uniref:Alpha-galactosidase n=1 Tax=Psilocybe cf. subviscida TaxID=2480587 RepID=A0A8H5BHP1_9AGAR|nr:hypothetical protein D9619_001327 [Psilocybe cf. subviscida]
MLKVSLVTLSLIAAALAQAANWAQCGGQGWTGATTCQSGWTCTYSNPFYSQCLQSGASTTASSTASTTSHAANPSLTGIAATAPTTLPITTVGKLPALGWNSWNAYFTNINEDKILAAANQFVSLGLKDAGYQYVNIDDAWSQQSGRDANTKRILPDFNKFPDGINGLATKIHNLGLKIGIYSDAGTKTCAGYPGSLGYEAIDAATFSDWGIDYLKYDNCNVPGNWSDASTPQNNDWYNSNSAVRYRQMTQVHVDFYRHTERLIEIYSELLSLRYRAPSSSVCASGARPTSGIGEPKFAAWSFITSVININVAHLSANNFYSHNDMDMMEIGNGALTTQEQRTHFAAWTFLKSPILLGTDLSKLSSTQLAIIKNAELLAFHQDATIGTPAKPFTAFSSMPSTSPPEYYSGASSKGTHVFIINTSSSTATKQFTFSNVPGLGSSGNFKVHDMWTGSDLSGTYAASATFTVSVAAHDTVAYRITKV